MNFYNPYMPTTQYQSSMPQQYLMPQQSTPSLPAQQILKVNGEESVKQVRMAPNSSALAMDTTAPIVWLLVSDGVGSVTSTPYDISEHKMDQRQSCCCETNRNIDSVKYENAVNTAAINANTTAQTQKILDAIAGNRMADMQNQINQLQLQAATCNVMRFPNQWTYAGGYFPPTPPTTTAGG